MPTRTFVVTRAESGRPLAEALRRRLSLSWSAAQRLVRERHVRVAGRPCLDPARRLTPRQRVEIHEPHPSPRPPPPRAESPDPPASPRPTRPAPRPPDGIVDRFQGAQVVVADKPPGLTTMRHADEAAEFGARAKRFLPPTLADLLPPLLARNRS